MQEASRKILEHGIDAIGLRLTSQKMDALIGYHDLLMSYNAKMNLTGHKDEEKSVVNNLLNSLAPWAMIEASHSTADVGSGGGLPGIPLAIALDMKMMALVESKEKKCRFLQDACKSFAPAVRVKQSDVNELQEPFQQIVSVAFAPLEKLLRTTKRCRAGIAKIYAWKGTRETIDKELAECAASDRSLWQIKPFTVPGLHDVQRHMCIYVPKASRKAQ